MVNRRDRRLIRVAHVRTPHTHTHKNSDNISGAPSPRSKKVAGSRPAGVDIFLPSLLLVCKNAHNAANSKQPAGASGTLRGCLSTLQQTGNSSRVEPKQHLHTAAAGRGSGCRTSIHSIHRDERMICFYTPTSIWMRILQVQHASGSTTG